MRSTKRGIAIDSETVTEIYRIHRLAGISENAVINRMIEIARESIAPFDDAGLRRIFREPWKIVKENPRLVRQIQKHSHSRLVAIASARLTAADKAAIRDLARKEKTSMSAIQRRILERLVAQR